MIQFQIFFIELIKNWSHCLEPDPVSGAQLCYQLCDRVVPVDEKAENGFSREREIKLPDRQINGNKLLDELRGREFSVRTSSAADQSEQLIALLGSTATGASPRCRQSD